MPRKLFVLGLAVVLASISTIAVADSHEPSVYVWINLLRAKPGQGDALMAMMMEEDAKVFDPLVESGAALEWGIAIPVVHPDTATHVEWVTFAGWEGADRFMQDFMAKQQSTSDEDRKATGDRWAALVEPGSHADVINRSVVLGTLTLSRPSYIHLAYFTAKSGKEREAVGMFEQFNPIFDQLIADATILNYGMHVPAMHRGEDWTHMGWWTSKNLSARDAVSSAFESPDNQEAMMRWGDTFESEHMDQILMVVHHKLPEGGD